MNLGISDICLGCARGLEGKGFGFPLYYVSAREKGTHLYAG